MNKLCRTFVFLSALFFFSNLPWFLPYEGIPLIPWHSYVVVLGGTLMFALFRLEGMIRALPRYLVVWAWLYMIHGILMFLYSSQNPDGLQMLKDRLIDTTLLGTLLMMLNLRPGMVPVVQKAILWTVLISVLVNLVDFVDPMFSRVEGRAAGFYINPNIAAQVMSLGMVACIPLVAPRLRLIFCLLVGIGVFVTFSRSGWLNWAVSIVAMTRYGFLVFRHKWPSILFFGLLGIAMIYTLLSGLALELLSALNLSGYLTPDTLARISGFDISFKDYSTSERVRLINYSWEVIQQFPLLGTGTDLKQWFTELPHNMYLLTLTQGGVLGLLMFLALLRLLWRNTNKLGRSILSVYIFSSLFTHNNLEGPTTLLIIALIANLRTGSAHTPLEVRRRQPAQPSPATGRPWDPQPALWSQQRFPPS